MNKNLYTSELRIFKAKVLKIEDNFIYLEIPGKTKEIRTNIILTPFLTNSLANFAPIKPKQNDEIFVLYESGKDQLPVALILGRNKFNELDKENAYLRVDILNIFKSGTKKDNNKFIKFDFKVGEYHFKIQNSEIKVNSSEIIEKTSSQIQLSVNPTKLMLSPANFELSTSGVGIVKADSGLTLKGAGMTITLSENIFKIKQGKGVLFEKEDYGPVFKITSNNEINIILRNDNKEKHLVYWEDLKSWWETQKQEIQSTYDNHFHEIEISETKYLTSKPKEFPSQDSSVPVVSSMSLDSLSDNTKVEKLIIK